MNQPASLAEARRRGIIVRLLGDRLHLTCPVGSLDADLESALRAEQAAVLAALMDTATVRSTPLTPPSVGFGVPPPHHGSASVREDLQSAGLPPAWHRPSPAQLRSMAVTDESILRMLARHDSSLVPRVTGAASGCHACGSDDWYTSSHPAQRVCRRCHPPMHALADDRVGGRP